MRHWLSTRDWSLCKCIFHFLFVSIFLSACNNTSPVETQHSSPASPTSLTEYWPNGKLKSEEPLMNGVRNGVGQYFHDNGKLYGKIPWKDGKKNGVFKLFRPDGTLEQVLSYVDGAVHGEIQWFKEDGTLQAKSVFQHGQQVE
jgi:hypothetical protein